ncbi:hypothetical protein D3C71_1406360 [compost metagenome]
MDPDSVGPSITECASAQARVSRLVDKWGRSPGATVSSRVGHPLAEQLIALGKSWASPLLIAMVEAHAVEEIRYVILRQANWACDCIKVECMRSLGVANVKLPRATKFELLATFNWMGIIAKP